MEYGIKYRKHWSKKVRLAKGRKEAPSYALIDSQSANTNFKPPYRQIEQNMIY